MSPDDRKRAIVAAALPVLREHGKDATTKQIAEAAGIAEGTIFRVFASKEELVEAVVASVFDPLEYVADIEAIDLDQPLRERMLALTELMQRRFASVFELMIKLALPKPPGPPPHRSGAHDHSDDWRDQVRGRMTLILAADADRFRLPVDEVIRVLRLLTFSGSHPHITEQQLMTPDEIVDVVLHGTLTHQE